MPLIRIDDEVYSALQRNAVAFEDTPNAVLRRVMGLDLEKKTMPAARHVVREKSAHYSLSAAMTAKKLAKAWGVKVEHCLYHRDGTFFENLVRFPGALFDPKGYVVFKTEADYVRSPHLHIGQKLNVPNGIAKIPGYVKIERGLNQPGNSREAQS